MSYRVQLHYGPYEHEETVHGADDEEQAIAIAWGRMRRAGHLTLPMAYTSATAEPIGDSE